MNVIFIVTSVGLYQLIIIPWTTIYDSIVYDQIIIIPWTTIYDSIVYDPSNLTL